MTLRILQAVLLSAVSIGASASPLLTQKCSTDFGNGRVAFRAETNFVSEVLAVAADPKRDPELYDRLWQPLSGERPQYLPGYGSLFFDPVQDTHEISVHLRADPVLKSRGLLDVFEGGGACFAALPAHLTITVVEFHNRFLNHYFLSSSDRETKSIESGLAGEGWTRTGEGFQAIGTSYCDGSSPVFRFYDPGANTHFFTVDPGECGQLRNREGSWKYEGDAFGAEAPVNGACRLGTQAVYRLYNNRWMFNDSNHRFVARADLYESMKALGWVGEGVAYCVRS
jgi:hypothetical protein